MLPVVIDGDAVASVVQNDFNYICCSYESIIKCVYALFILNKGMILQINKTL